MSEKQTFDGSAARHALAEQPGWKHLRVVQDEEVPRAQVITQLSKRREFWGGGGMIIAMHDEQARRSANRGRLLRDQLIRQIEGEILNVHRAE